MTDRPILFSAPMVRALLAGTKTQTRRVMKPQPLDGKPELLQHLLAHGHQRWAIDNSEQEWVWKCPYGQPGDRLWARETWAPGDEMVFGESKDDPETVLYRADEAALHWDGKAMRTPMDTYAFNWSAVRWKPSIFMPRWASRITLEVTGVRVERLQDISEADAIAEGVERTVTGDGWRRYADQASELAGLPPCASPGESYLSLWEQINGHGSWEANPWVWVVEFKRVGA